MPIHIIVIDDHKIFNDGLKLLLNDQPDLKVSAQVFQAKDALFTIQEHNPDLVILDINLQGMNGIDLGKKIITDFSKTKVIILTMYNQPKLLEEAQNVGLHGYLLKDTTTAELLTVIRTVLAGNTHFVKKGSHSEPFENDPFGDDFAKQLHLTFREVEIIRLIKAGLNNDQIAERLGVSFFTVKTHRKNIHFKLNINNVAELIQFAINHNL